MEFKYIIYSILAATIVGFFIFSYYDIRDLIPDSSRVPVISNFAVSSEEIGVNESLSISVEAEGNEIVLIGYSSLNKEETLDCKREDSCKGTFSDSFALAGIYQIKVKVVDGENKEFEQKKTIRVINRENTCIDGTKFNECSNNVPKFCMQGSLEDNCSICGCNEKYFCFNESCMASADFLNIKNVEAVGFNIVRINSPFSIKITLQNPEEEILKGAYYLLDVNIIDSAREIYLNIQKEFNLQSNLQNSDLLEIVIDRDNTGVEIRLEKEDEYDLDVALYGMIRDGKYSLLDLVTVWDFVSASADKTAPSKPTGLTATKTAEGVLLSWNPNLEADLMAYDIYESISVEPIYISYRFRESVSGEENSIKIKDLENKKYYFVITAVDYLGNESQYSEPVAIDLSCPTCGG